MAYTTIDNPELYHQNKIYSGNNSSQSITFDGSENMRPDWLWIKCRTHADSSQIVDSVRGTFAFRSDSTIAEADISGNGFTSYDSDGFTLNGSNGGGNINNSGRNYVAFAWSAGGASPAITYTVKVVSDSGNKYRFDDFGTSAVTLDLQEGGTYTFDQSDSSNSGHPLRFSTTSNGTHGGGSEYTTGVTTTGTPGSSGAKTVITVAASAPTLYYYCTQHSGMGGQANTNSTFGSSNFSGNIQSTVSANTTAGFSIVTWTADNSNNNQIGHSLNTTPKLVIWYNRSNGGTIAVGSPDILGSNSYLNLNSTAAKVAAGSAYEPLMDSDSITNFGYGTSPNMVAYCFAEKKGYSKFGSYTGNQNTDGQFVYTGFRPAWVMVKRTDSTSDWLVCDNKRDTDNPLFKKYFPNQNQAEDSYESFDFLANGFKITSAGTGHNASGATMLYMAVAESPFVNSNGVPNNAR